MSIAEGEAFDETWQPSGPWGSSARNLVQERLIEGRIEGSTRPSSGRCVIGVCDGCAMEPSRARLRQGPDKRKTLAVQGFFGGSGGGI